uniref:Polymerase/histidinol phosphatase N-terminal domain-containing protein n=1 Tax=candidate division CPR3 bacterium TaxID=2268181 RepID=A0A7C4R5C5_UNCC3
MRFNKILLLIVCFFVLFSTKTALSAMKEGIPCLMHVHTEGWSDGELTVEQVAEAAKRYGYKCVQYSDHGDSFKTVDDFPYYINQINSVNQNGSFVTFYGREITLGNKRNRNNKLSGNDCHINAMSGLQKPFIDGTFHNDSQLKDVLAILKKEDAIWFWNHPRTCPQWKKWIKSFHGIEVFNEYVTQRDLNYYLEAVGAGWKGMVIGGMDLHYWGQFGSRITTFIFADSITRTSILDNLRKQRSTIATIDVASVKVSAAPGSYSFEKSRGRTITISITFNKPIPLARNFEVYHNGSFYSRLDLVYENNAYHIKFKIPESGSFIFVIPGYLITSPYWLK